MSLIKAITLISAVSIAPLSFCDSNLDRSPTFGSPAEPQQIDAAERIALSTAMSSLEHYMYAGMDSDVDRGAELLISFSSDQEQAKSDTEAFYRKQAKLLKRYVTISSDIYGYELKETPFGARLLVEGAVETVDGLEAEFSARMVIKHKRWRIADLDID